MNNGIGDAGDDWTGAHFRLTIERKRRLALAILLLAIILLLPLSSASALMGGRGLMWTVWASAPVPLVVCWENPSAAEPLSGEVDQTSGAQRREHVRLALKRTWEREARIIFTGWQTCQKENTAATPPHTYGPRRPGTADENLKVTITNSGGGQNPGHGSWGDYQKEGIILNLHCGSQACIEYLAIHEFGHALGFYHEEERGDWPTNIPGCDKQTWPDTYPWWPVPIAELRWGAPDRDSVMAYCSGQPTALSPGDVAAVQRAYERHLPGTLLSQPGSLCLSAHATAANGENAFGWACDEANDDQEWHYDAVNQALYITEPGKTTRRCLDVDTLNYSDVQIWSCHYGANQQWRFQSVAIRGYGGLCLTRPVAGAGSLTMQTCNGSARQLWRVVKSDLTGFVRLYAGTGNLCLTLSGGSGSDALAQPCWTDFLYLPSVVNASATSRSAAASSPTTPTQPAAFVQDFVLGDKGLIGVPGFPADSLCLDVQDVWDSDYITGQGGPVAGRRVQFFKCYSTQLNQKWNFSGHVVSGGKCLALSGSATNNGAGANVTTCSTAPQQNWDYYW
ncbi:MAG: ricin-type beta-trefoil lectin domain protein [Anaerolineae bacterium]|nr:ricin-type beta-trefoil lectin domain protein [Anaerolineae bacterium]